MGMTARTNEGQSDAPKPFEMKEEEEKVCELLSNMLKSHVLVHVDLSDCGLTEGMLLELSKTIAQSQSLLTVHLSGNMGLKDEVIRKI